MESGPPETATSKRTPGSSPTSSRRVRSASLMSVGGCERGTAGPSDELGEVNELDQLELFAELELGSTRKIGLQVRLCRVAVRAGAALRNEVRAVTAGKA